VLIQVAETHPAAPGKKTASVVAVGGSKFDCWPEMLAKIEIGRCYEIEVKDRVFQGRTYQSITKATPYAEDGDSTVATKAAPRAAENGYGSGISYQHTGPGQRARVRLRDADGLHKGRQGRAGAWQGEQCHHGLAHRVPKDVRHRRSDFHPQ
jgi:hypothetical protein